MGCVIVMAGKGGTGKTTCAALLVRRLMRDHNKAVLCVDADPNSNLAQALGVKDTVTVADIVDEVARQPQNIPPAMGKDAFIEYRIHREIGEHEGFDLLVMGRPEGPGCYCYINNVLRSVMSKLITDYPYTVIDNEAGLEHFSRKTTRACDVLCVVADDTAVGMRSSVRIFQLTEELGIAAGRKFLIVNRHSPARSVLWPENMVVDERFFISYDEQLMDLTVAGDPVSKLSEASVVWQDVGRISERLA